MNTPWKATLKLPVRFFDFLLGEHSAFARGLRFSSRMACGLEAVMR